MLLLCAVVEKASATCSAALRVAYKLVLVLVLFLQGQLELLLLP
jgi:hypothetical protein